ncbi:uncharacterized protein LOC115078642 isoform X1 [Rhinatrema bivittatum]|uniref:uncharacterized protein LOC115078642 isoform X1 n=1 Tax=Rhinatrema bivittatum TaxID=194408 RepID=UPI00112A1619|nr:uncharacterized protein LOC115078642 isoform X1 [Rhinatrema bivittatum]
MRPQSCQDADEAGSPCGQEEEGPRHLLIMIPLFVTSLACMSAWCLRTVKAQTYGGAAAPSLAFEPEQTVYISDSDKLTMRCVAPNPSTLKGYTFFRNRAAVLEDSEQNVYRLDPVREQDEGSFLCVYTTKAGVRSSESADRTLNVEVRGPPPQILFQPKYAVFVKGEEVSVQCTHPQLPGQKAYHFFKDGRQLTEARGQPEQVHRIPALLEGNGGDYRCSYSVEVSGREISSLQSEAQPLLVIEPLPAPQLFILPSPVGVGQKVTVTCEAPGASTVTGYHFYKDGRQITEPQGSAQDTYILNGFSEADRGSYFCLYWRNMSNREILSPESQRLRLDSNGNIFGNRPGTTTGESGLSTGLVYLIFFGGKLLVLVMVLLIFGLCHIHQKIKMRALKEDE